MKTQKLKMRKVQFSFSPQTVGVLDDLKKETNAASWAEVVRNALYVYNWMLRMILRDGEIFAIEKDGKPQKVILPNVAK